MKRYIATNAEGRAANGEMVEVGKYGKGLGKDRADLLNRVNIVCCPSIESAVLSSSTPPDQCRVFLVECWGAERPETAYSVIREVEPVPRPTRFQRLAFAVALLSRAATTLPLFQKWAEDWLQNRDRSPEHAAAVRERLSQTAPEEHHNPSGLSAWARDLEQFDADDERETQWVQRTAALLKAIEAIDPAERDVLLGRALFGWGEWKVPVDNITKAILALGH